MALQERKIKHEDEVFTHYFLFHYIPKSYGNDQMSRSLLSFKEGRSPHRRAWIDCAVEQMKSKRDLEGAYVIRALGHNEQQAPKYVKQALDFMGIKLSHILSGSYAADLLSKVKEVPKITRLTKPEREAATSNAYRFTLPDRMPKRVLIIDDILTSGATVRAIIAAVLRAAPSCDVTVFTLAVTDYDPSLNADVKLKASYEWLPDEGWMVVAEDSAEYAATLAKLKSYILNNAFPDSY